MKQYLDLCREVLEHGEKRGDRTGTGTISKFGYQMRVNLEDGFPLLTTKKVFYRGIFEELFWFLKGETNIRPLALKNVKIWNDWPYAKYKKSAEYQGETMEEFTLRCLDGLEEVFRDMMHDQVTRAAMITHGGIISNMLRCFGIPKYEPDVLTAKFGEGFDIIVTAQMWLNSQAFEILGYCPYEKIEDIDGDER